MEVHHHPHIPHGKKPFKEYFLEFLMIFLAVTMGFIAENVRETISDHSKEHEYIESMLENLGSDTTNLRSVMKETYKQYKGLDTLHRINKQNLGDLKTQDSLFYYTVHYLFYISNFKNNDITLVQLRNAGGYRLLRNKRVLDSLSDYESRVKDLNEEYAFIAKTFDKTRDAATELFDLTTAPKFLKRNDTMPVLLTTDKVRITYYYNQCIMNVSGLSSYYNMMREHMIYTKSLIRLIRSEYHLTKE